VSPWPTLLVLAALYLLNQRIVAKAALIQAQGASQTTANVGTLSTTAQQQYAGAQAAYSAGNKALGDQLMASYNATLLAIQKVGAAPAATMNFSAWFQQNWGWLMLGLGALWTSIERFGTLDGRLRALMQLHVARLYDVAY